MNGSKSHFFVKAEEENEVAGEAEQCLYNKRGELRDVCLMTWLQVNIQAKEQFKPALPQLHFDILNV